MDHKLKILSNFLACVFVFLGLSIIVVLVKAEEIDQKSMAQATPTIQLLSQVSGSTPTPFQPMMPTATQGSEIVPVVNVIVTETAVPTLQPTVIQPTATPEVLSFEQALKMGWISITIYTPWGENLVFSFSPVFVDLKSTDLPAICPYDGHSGCVQSFGDGVYVVVHSEYQGAVAEGARQSIEGLLYPLSVIKEHIAGLQNADVQITTTDGRIIKAKVAEITRITSVNNIYQVAENRYANPGSLVLEFCGLPHVEDQSDKAGVTGSVYKITIIQ